MQVEFHYQRGTGDQAANDDMDQPSAREMLNTLQQLQRRGLRAFNIEPNYWCAQCTCLGKALLPSGSIPTAADGLSATALLIFMFRASWRKLM